MNRGLHGEDTLPPAGGAAALPDEASAGAADESVTTAVTVLVRTVDRPSLPRAVQSALAQGPRVEVLVVAAHGRSLQALGGLAADARVRVLQPPRPLARAAAANAALQAATTPWLLFLDDDDWLLPGHVTALATALQAHPEAVATYTGVQGLGGDPAAPQPLHRFDHEADRAAMQLQNQLPIHAVLFRAAALAAYGSAPALAFDESLEHFEDWDFWLRLMARGDFVRVPGVSAIYWQDSDAGSGHAADGPRRRERLARFAQRQLARWSPDDVVDLIDLQVAQGQLRDDLAHRLAEAQQAAVELQQQAEQQARALHQRLVEVSAERDEARGQVLDLRQTRAVLAEEGERLKLERSALREDRDAHRRELLLVSAQRDAQGQQLHQLQQRIEALLNSSSWRLTRPWRAGGRLLAALRGGRLPLLWRNGVHLLRASQRRYGSLGVARRVLRALPALPGTLRALSRPAATPATAAPAPEFTRPRLHPELLADAAEPEAIDAKVSVVVPVLNGGDDLVLLLRKLSVQRGVRELEVVIVDSGSTDGTPERARALGARVIEIPQTEFSHSHARNLGADAATGNWLLFMVQDACPLGELWLHGLLAYLIDERERNVVAVSCAEHCRADSDAMYDCMIATHYRFLGCDVHDRIGQHAGDDQLSLRTMGQLSDVACLIPREVFQRFRYRGHYAEDMDLGIRLIQAGYRIAMLASVKVIHSHRRPAWYFLKRACVDVVFLSALFEDFPNPACESLAGLVRGLRVVAQRLAAGLPEIAAAADGDSLSALLDRWVVQARQWPLRPDANAATALGDERMDAFVDQVWREAAPWLGAAGARGDAAADAEARRTIEGFVARLDHFNRHAATIFPGADARLRTEYAEAVCKTYAATVGALLAQWTLDRRRPGTDAAERALAERLLAQLQAGV